MSPVNELSCTIDLDSTLIRAEALFKRFQRLVDAIDKKGNFPAPRQRLVTAQSSESGGSGLGKEPSDTTTSAASAQGGTGSGTSNSSGGNTGKAPLQSQQQQQQKQPEKVITPDLRRLLSRQVEVLPRKEVAKKGDWLAGTKGR